MVSTGTLIRVAIVAIVGSTLASIGDLTIGIELLDQIKNALDLTQYL